MDCFRPGAAAGVGCSLALAADLVIASESAYFLQAFSHVGLVPEGGASYRLTRSAGRARAMEMMLLGERIAAQKALEWGMINCVVSDGSLNATSMELAARLAKWADAESRNDQEARLGRSRQQLGRGSSADRPGNRRGKHTL